MKATAGGPALLLVAAPATCCDKRQTNGADPKTPPGGRVAGPVPALSGRRADDPQGREEHCRDLVRSAVLEERARIARELHDVVAHHMSVTVVRAEAALVHMPGLPDAAKETLEVVRDAARAALDETRRVVGLLRAEQEHVRHPGLDRLGELVGAACGSGLRASALVIGCPRQLEADVELAAFRVVQESLSNAVRYAPGAHVAVELRYGPRTLTVSVTDDGARTAPGVPHGGGHGLLGMRERVMLLGGTVHAGPRNGAGWSVVAELPFAAVGSLSPTAFQDSPQPRGDRFKGGSGDAAADTGAFTT
ncbi:sensor histidine kinase [Spirillospora sp. NPDC050679]